MIPGGFKNMNADQIIQCILVVMLKLEKFVKGLVEDQIIDGVIDKAPSQNAVYDALAAITANFSKFKIKLEDSFDYTAAQDLVGENQIISIPADGKASIVLVNNGLQSLDGIDYSNIIGNTSAEIPHPGKPYFIFNHTDNPITLNHNVGIPSDIYKPFIFYNEENLVLPPGGMAEFKFNDVSNTFDKVPGGDGTTVVNDLITGGTTDALSAEMGKFLKFLIDSIYQPNVLISSVPPTRSANTFTYPDDEYVALIDKTIRTNISAFSTTILPASTINHKRIDLVYFDSDNTLKIVTGIEDLSVAQRPDLPANSVAVSYISIIGNTVYDPTTITDELSIQDSLGFEIFKVSNYLRIKGASFNAGAKQIEIDPSVPLSAFLDPVDGNDMTAVLENANKPFKTFKALQEALPTYAGETYTIYITGGTIPITRQIVNRNFNWVAYTPVTLDFTNCMLADGTTHATNCLTLASYGSAATWDFRNSNISIVCNYNGVKFMSYVSNNSTTRMLGNIDVLDWRSPSTQNYRPSFYFAGNSDLIFNKIYNSPQDAIYPIGAIGTSKILVREYIVQYNNRGLFASENTNYLTVDKITQIGTTTLTFVYGIANPFTEVTIGDVNFNVPSTFLPKAGTLICKGKFNANVIIDLAQTGIISGTLDSVNYPKNSFCQARQEFRNYNGKLEGLLLFGVNALLVITDSNITTTGILARNNDYSNDGRTLVEFNGFNSIVQLDKTKALFYSRYDDISQNTITNIVDNGQVVTNADTFGIRVNYSKITATFKEELKKIVIRSKIDLSNKVLDSNTNYVADGNITFLAGEFIRVPNNTKGLTLSSYGINSGKLIKNVAGEPLFISETGGSGDLILQNITIDTGLGSVFNLEDTVSAHAIEMKDVNFENCTSLGTIKGYRQFTGQTMGAYNCADGLTLDGAWNGFALGRYHVRGLAATGTLFKKGAALQFSNRFSLGVNLSGVTGIKLCDFDETNFLRDEMFQLDDCTVEVNGVISAANTVALIPNITARNPKCSWINSKGITLSPLNFLDMKSPDGNVWRISISNAGTLSMSDI